MIENMFRCELEEEARGAALSRREEIDRNRLLRMQGETRRQNNGRVHLYGGASFSGNFLCRLRACDTGTRALKRDMNLTIAACVSFECGIWLQQQIVDIPMRHLQQGTRQEIREDGDYCTDVSPPVAHAGQSAVSRRSLPDTDCHNILCVPARSKAGFICHCQRQERTNRSLN